MHINSTPSSNFNGLWERKIKSYGGSKYSELNIATYHPFSDEEITPEIKRENQSIRGYFCMVDIGYNSAGEWVPLNCLNQKVIGKPLNITRKEYRECANLKSAIKGAEEKLEFYQEQLKNISNLIYSTQDKNAKSIYQQAWETLKGEIKQTESFIEQTQAKIKDIDSKYSDECPFDEIRHSDRIDNKRIFNSQEINEVLENIDYRREYK